jgi:1-deoxy-D-xylulose-5-phosphate synthase
LKDEKDNVIAIIEDGSLSGGEAYEGLNNAAEAGTNMIIIVNFPTKRLKTTPITAI